MKKIIATHDIPVRFGIRADAVRNNRRRVLQRGLLLLGSVLLASVRAMAQNGAPAPRPDDQFSFMQLLTDQGIHDIENERWTAYGQASPAAARPARPHCQSPLWASCRARDQNLTGSAARYRLSATLCAASAKSYR